MGFIVLLCIPTDPFLRTNEEYIHSRIVLQYVALAYVRSLLNSTYVTLPLGTVSYCTVRLDSTTVGTYVRYCTICLYIR